MNSNKQKVAPFTGQVASPTFPVRGQQESISFFDILWGDDPPDGVIVLWRESDRISQFFHPENKDDLVFRAQEIDLKGDVYFGIGMQKEALNENRRGTAESVIAIPGLWLDLDIKGPNHKNKNLIPSVEAAEDFISRFSLRPSMIVNSGYGFHCYWIFKEPWVFENDNEWQEAVNLSKRFHQIFIAKAKDNNWELDNTADLARLLRIPGTSNHKSSPPIPVQIIDQNDNRYNPDDFEQFFISDHTIEINNETVPETNTDQNVPQNASEGNDSDSLNRQTVNELINRCDFLKYCKDDAALLSEPEWHKMICLLAHEYGGSEAIHELSKPYPKYSKQETDQYILKALQRSISPITCEAIKQDWNCNRDCAVKSPIHLKQEILKELGIVDSKSSTIDSDNTDDESFNDMDLLKERIPNVPFPWSSFPPYLSASLKDLAEDMAVQPEMCGVIALGILSTAVGSMVKSVEAKKGYKSSVNLWTVIIAGTGEKKTPVFNRLMKPVHQFQKQLIDKYKKDYQVWENNQKVAQAAAQKGTQKSQKNNPEPKRPSLYTTDPTIEALIELLNDNKHGILLFQDEISGFLLSFDKYRRGKGGDREQYLSLWSSTAIKIDRVSKKLYVPDPFLSLLGGLQPGKAVRLFGEDSFDDGLITRFLFYNNDDIYKKLTNHQWRDDYEKMWNEMVLYLYTMDTGSKLELKLNDDAWQVFMDYYNSLTEISHYVPVRFQVFIPKAMDYVLRISGLLHVLESVMNGQKTILPSVSVDTVNRAVNLVYYFLSQARQIVESYGPKRQKISMDSKHVLASILAVYDSKKSLKLPTEEIHGVYNNSVPKEAQIGTIISFGKLVKKTLKEFKIKYKKDRLYLDGKNRQGFIFEKESLESIKKLLEL